jgi:hypothetical protein
MLQHAAEFPRRHALRWWFLRERKLSMYLRKPLLIIQQGNCNGNFGGEVKDWFERHKTLVIGVAAGVGGLIVLCIFMCCWRSYRRRRNRKAYAAKMGGAPPMYPGPPPQQRSDRRGRGPPPPQPPMGQGWAPQGQNQWAPQTGHGPPIPTPPPLHQRPMRYA